MNHSELSKAIDKALENMNGRSRALKIASSVQQENGYLPGRVDRGIINLLEVDESGNPKHPDISKEMIINLIAHDYEMSGEMGEKYFIPVVHEILRQIAEYDGPSSEAMASQEKLARTPNGNPS